MTLELASERIVRKPWGKTDLRPWSERGHDGAPIGEVWFQRADPDAREPTLLLKLLFTDEPLSIQVHPDDAFARKIGLPNGKTEAWYVLDAEPGARVALGLKRELTPPQLRAAIADGSLHDLVRWRDVRANESVLVPAGTIHAVGAGLVLAEIQQRSDATFRLFDYGRSRELHLDGAVGAAIAGPAGPHTAAERLNEARLVVASSPYFVLEQIDLIAGSHWEIDGTSETWMLMLEGKISAEQLALQTGEAVYIDAQRVRVRAGSDGAKALVAYVASEPDPMRLVSRNGEAPTAMIERFQAVTGVPKSTPLETAPLDIRS